MTVIHHLDREEHLPETCRLYVRDTITLGWEDRVQGHGRRRSDGGVEFALALPRGSVLRAGDCFVLDDARTVVAVVERPEPVFVIEPRSTQEWALFAYHIGNRHQPIMITERALVCPDAPGVAQLLRQQHIPHSPAMLPFTPASAAVPGHHH
jgi:urease accessory protein